MLNHSQTGNEHQKQMENMIALVDNLANDNEETEGRFASWKMW